MPSPGRSHRVGRGTEPDVRLREKITGRHVRRAVDAAEVSPAADLGTAPAAGALRHTTAAATAIGRRAAAPPRGKSGLDSRSLALGLPTPCVDPRPLGLAAPGPHLGTRPLGPSRPRLVLGTGILALSGVSVI